MKFRVVVYVLLLFLPIPAFAQLPEPLTIQDTEYKIPSDKVLFVATTGDDADDGTLEAPLRTIAKAISKASSGYTIVIRGGTYREATLTFYKTLTFQPYPHEEVWIKGSEVIDGWVADGDLWRKDGWTNQFCRNCYQHSSDPYWNSINDDYPYAAYPDMAFVDGDPLKEVGSVAELEAETEPSFCVDYDSAQIFLNLQGLAPDGHIIEAAKQTVAMKIGASGAIVRGLGFAHYASYVNPSYSGRTVAGSHEWAMVIGGSVSGADHLTFEKNTFAFSAGNGLMVTKPNAKVVDNIMIYNGQAGMQGNRMDDSLIAGNIVRFNNFEHFNFAPEAAGIKVCHTSNLKVEGNLFYNNYSSGLWLDEWDYNASVINNKAVNNANKGLYFEISGLALFAGNLIAENSIGLTVMGSSDVRIYNNTFSANGTNLLIGDDSRESNPTNYPDAWELGITFNTYNTEVVNNLFSECKAGGTNLFTVRDYTKNTPRAGMDMISTIDYNGYFRTNANAPKNLVEWWDSGAANYFLTFASYQAATSQDANSIQFENLLQNPFFADRDDYALLPDSPALSRGKALPEDVAKALNISDTAVIEQPNMGAWLQTDSTATYRTYRDSHNIQGQPLFEQRRKR
jgi:hypothetical protein